MNNKVTKRNLAGYWAGIQSALDARLLSVKEYLRHPASGFNAESYFRDLLREYLPKRYSVDTGFVVNASGEHSDFIDVIIADTQHIPPLCSEPHFKVFAAESVAAALEITSAPKSNISRKGQNRKVPKIEDDLVKIARVRQIAKQREYIETFPSIQNGQLAFSTHKIGIDLCPRSFLITCGDEWEKADTYERHLVSALTSAKQNGHEVWVNAVLSMKHGMFHVAPYTEFTINRIKENAMLEFLLFLNSVISEYHTYRIDIRRYRPTIPRG